MYTHEQNNGPEIKRLFYKTLGLLITHIKNKSIVCFTIRKIVQCEIRYKYNKQLQNSLLNEKKLILKNGSKKILPEKVRTNIIATTLKTVVT